MNSPKDFKEVKIYSAVFWYILTMSIVVFIAIIIGNKSLLKNDNLLKQIQDKNILLEICPTSNIQTNAFNSYKEHPVRLLYDKKININNRLCI